jgi:hypothetical protein
MGEDIGIQNGDAVRGQKVSDGGFTAADATAQGHPKKSQR